MNVSRALMLQQRPAMIADASPSLFLTIHNAGRHPVLVQGWAIRADKKAAGHENFVYKLTALPKLLKEGKTATEQTDDLSLLAIGAKGIYAWDASGKKWYLPRRQFRNRRKEAADLLRPD